MLESAPDEICASPYGLGSDHVRTPSTVNALPGSRPLGGLIASRPGGTIAWRADGEQASVGVEGFAPLLRGSLWRLELSFHDLVGRRFLARVAREVP